MVSKKKAEEFLFEVKRQDGETYVNLTDLTVYLSTVAVGNGTKEVRSAINEVIAGLQGLRTAKLEDVVESAPKVEVTKPLKK